MGYGNRFSSYRGITTKQKIKAEAKTKDNIIHE
jgi:hypothetical protein